MGARDVTLPVAAHMPAGGVASINFRLAVRMRLEVDALVEVRERRPPGELGGFSDCKVVARGRCGDESGCGKGTGVDTLALASDEAMPVCERERFQGRM